MVYAQANGLVDYRHLDSRDSNHSLYERTMLHEAENQLLHEVRKLRFVRHAAGQACTPIWDENASIFKHHSSEASKLYSDIGKALIPWVSWRTAEDHTIKADDVVSLLERWEVVFGKVDSPEVQAKMANYAIGPTAPDTARWIK